MSDTQSQENIIDSPNTTDSASPGELLARQREQLGIPLTDAARALNLRPAVVEGLEQDDYQEIPVAAYRRGYLRSYAKYLGMDDRLVLEAYQARSGVTDTEHKVTPVSTARPPSRIGAWLFKLVTLLVIAGLIAVTVMWWQSRGGNEPPGFGSTSTEETANATAEPAEAENSTAGSSFTSGDESAMLPTCRLPHQLPRIKPPAHRMTLTPLRVLTNQSWIAIAARPALPQKAMNRTALSRMTVNSSLPNKRVTLTASKPPLQSQPPMPMCLS